MKKLKKFIQQRVIQHRSAGFENFFHQSLSFMFLDYLFTRKEEKKQKKRVAPGAFLGNFFARAAAGRKKHDLSER